MSTHSNSQNQEQPSTYFVQDRRNKEELIRLTIQDRMLTTSMGGVLPEQAEPALFRRVLDIGCGSGSWCIDAAKTYPEMSLTGVDISQRMIKYAHEQAISAHVSHRVDFHVMDALRQFAFPPSSFDLVNIRCAVSFMRTWDWPNLIGEVQRVARPGGTIRVTEPEVIQPSNSPACLKLFEILQDALFQAGHLFENNTTGLSAHLAPLLSRYGCRQVQTKDYALTYQAGTPQGEEYFDDIRYGFRTTRPFLQKWSTITVDNYEVLYQQAVDEMRQSTFHATLNLCTAWGTTLARDPSSE